MARKTQAQIEFKVVTSEFTSGIKEMNSSLKTMNNELKLNATQLKGNSDNVDLLQQRQNILQRELEASNQKIEYTEAALQEAASLLGENSREYQNLYNALLQAGTQQQAIQNEITQTNQKLESLQNASNEANRELEQLGDDTNAFSRLNSEIDKQQQELNELKQDYSRVALEQGESSTEAQELASRISSLSTELRENQSRLREAESSADQFDHTLDDLGDAAEESEEGFTVLKGTIANVCGNVISSAISSITGLVSSLLELSEATVEINTNQGKLQAAIADTGHSIEYMDEQYTNLYGYLNDDMAVTNCILNMEKLGLSQKDTTALTDSAIAVWTAYGDSIPLEGLAESINETVLVGQITGTMADAVNWAKDTNINLGNALKGNKKAQAAYSKAVKEGLPVEDAFNAALGEVSDKSERAKLITVVLNATYGKSKDAYDKANQSLIEYNQSQGEYEKAQAELGSAMMPVNTAITNLKTSFMTGLAPAVETAGKAIQSFMSDLKSGKSGTEILNNVIGSINLNGIATKIQGAIPQIVQSAKGIMSTIGANIQANLPTVIGKGLDILQGLANIIAQNAPILIASGMDLLKNIAQGLVNSLPVLIQKIPTLITTVANTISTCMPIILVKGAEIIWQLAKGLVSAIPTLVANIPKIIQAIIAVWSAINWMNLGKNLISGIINGVKNLGPSLVSTGRSIFGNLKTSVLNVVNGLKSGVGNIFNGIRSGSINIFNGIRSSIGNIVSALRSNVINIFNGLKSRVGSIFNGIRSAIVKPVETAKNTMRRLVDAIKGFFHFKISWPHIPLPHFSISPAGWSVGDLLKGKIPSLGIKWYAKGGIMTEPTLFGGGEAGNEAILPLDGFYKYLDDKLSSINNNINIDYNELSEAIIKGLKHVKIDMDGKEVGKILDKRSGRLISFIERGVNLE